MIPYVSLCSVAAILIQYFTCIKVEEQEECSSISNARKEQENEDLSPLSVLEPTTSLSESCWSSECSDSSGGNLPNNMNSAISS